jgi:transcription elongation factor S-II
MALSTKEIELKGRALSKATASGDPSSTILSLLEDLRRGVVASEDILRTTKIGVSVNKLKQHKDPAVARNAGELVSKWRSDIRSKGHGANSTPTSTPKVGTGTAQKSELNSPASKLASPAPAAPGVKAKHTVPKDKRNSKLDGVDVAVTGNATRDACVKLMYDGLAFMSEECKC